MPPMMAVRCPGPELLERAIRYAVCGVDSVEPSALHSPTPCHDWDLRDLLHHLTESLLTLGELLGGPPLAGRTSEPVAGTRAAATLVLAVIARVDTNGISAVEGLPIPSSLVAYTGALEVALHAWDVTQVSASGQPMPAALAQDLLTVAPDLLTTVDRSGLFAPPVRPAPDATAAERLVAFAGRTPSRRPTQRLTRPRLTT